MTSCGKVCPAEHAKRGDGVTCGKGSLDNAAKRPRPIEVAPFTGSNTSIGVGATSRIHNGWVARAFKHEDVVAPLQLGTRGLRKRLEKAERGWRR